jgi:hypothetical protein
MNRRGREDGKMTQRRLHYRTYNHANNESVAAELAFFEGADTKEIAYKTTPSADGFVTATFTDVAPATVLRLESKSRDWALLRNPLFIPCSKDCRFEIAMCCVEPAAAEDQVSGSGVTALDVKIGWCEETSGASDKLGYPAATVLAIQDGKEGWKDSKTTRKGRAGFLLPRGKWYRLEAPGFVLCPGIPWIFACGEEALCLDICCRPSQLLCLIFEDLCGKRLPNAQCLVGGEKRIADENGEICVVNPPATGIALAPTGQLMFDARTIVMDDDRKTQTIRCQRVPAPPAKRHWIALDFEIDRPQDVLAILEPIGGAKGQEVILPLDASGRAAKEFERAATFLLKLIDKNGELLHTDVIQTELEAPQAGGSLLPVSSQLTPAS